MSYEIKKVAGLGTGVMGSQIAAHLSNANIEVYAFDMTQEISNNGLEACKKLKPSPFYNPKTSDLIKPLNYENDLNKLKECDWIVEAISEKLDWKQNLHNEIIPHLNNKTIITSNTSGLSLSDLSKDLPESFLKNFFITHFFNPPRYMKLLEIVPGERTKKENIEFLMHYGSLFLGKETVLCKDTPAFIANRVGIYSIIL